MSPRRPALEFEGDEPPPEPSARRARRRSADDRQVTLAPGEAPPPTAAEPPDPDAQARAREAAAVARHRARTRALADEDDGQVDLEEGVTRRPLGEGVPPLLAAEALRRHPGRPEAQAIVLHALARPRDMYALAQVTGLPVGAIEQALGILRRDGCVRPMGDGRWIADTTSGSRR